MTLKKLLLTGSIALALAGGVASASQASIVTIDFSGHGEWGAIGATYAPLGVTFSPGAIFRQCTGGCPPPDANGFFAYADGGPFTVTFANAQSDVSFQGVSFSGTAAFAYDAANSLIAQIADNQDFPATGFVNHLTGAGITRIEFSGALHGVPAITNLTFDSVAAVPEPATWAIMLTGFFGLGAMLRRRREFASAA